MASRCERFPETSRCGFQLSHHYGLFHIAFTSCQRIPLLLHRRVPTWAQRAFLHAYTRHQGHEGCGISVILQQMETVPLTLVPCWTILRWTCYVEFHGTPAPVGKHWKCLLKYPSDDPMDYWTWKINQDDFYMRKERKFWTMRVRFIRHIRAKWFLSDIIVKSETWTSTSKSINPDM